MHRGTLPQIRVSFGWICPRCDAPAEVALLFVEPDSAPDDVAPQPVLVDRPMT